MMEQILQLDKDIFLYLNTLGGERWDGVWLFITHKLSALPLYVLMLILIYRHYGWKGTLVILVAVALMITATDQLANLFKHGFKRPRPCQESAGMTEVMRFVAKNCGRYGYFSAHAASSMAAAIFIGLSLKPWYKKLLLILVIWSLVVGYSRIYLGVHYPSDVLTGFVIGVLIGWIFYRLQIWARRKLLKEGKIPVRPT